MCFRIHGYLENQRLYLYIYIIYIFHDLRDFANSRFGVSSFPAPRKSRFDSLSEGLTSAGYPPFFFFAFLPRIILNSFFKIWNFSWIGLGNLVGQSMVSLPLHCFLPFPWLPRSAITGKTEVDRRGKSARGIFGLRNIWLKCLIQSTICFSILKSLNLLRRGGR